MRKTNELAILSGGLLLLMLTVPLGALCDDWLYVTAPHLDFRFGVQHISRLFDGLYGWLLSGYPGLFPWLNHVIVVLTHTVNALLFYKTANELFGIEKSNALIFSLLFLLGSTSYATVCYTDTFNNTLSLMFGLFGILLYQKAKSYPVKIILYLAFSALSLLSKESGATFFAVIPLFDIIQRKGKANIQRFIKKALITYAFGLAIFAVYYFSPADSMQNSKFLPAHMIKNLLLGTAATYSAIDLNALLYSRNYIVFVISIILSIPAMIYALYTFVISLKKRGPDTVRLILLILCAVFAILPFTVSSYRSISEMHTYAEAFFALLTYCVIFKDAKLTKRKTLLPVLLAFIAAHTISVSEKYISSLQSSKAQYDFIDQYAERMAPIQGEPEIYIFNLNSDGDNSYSTFSANPQIASWFGYAINQLYGWKANISIFHLYNDSGINERVPFEVEHVYIDMPDGDFLLYAEGLAKEAQANGECDIAIVLMPDGQFFTYKE